MNKKKTSEQHAFSLTNIERIDINKKKLSEVKPQNFFKDHKNVAEALFQCLIDNDIDAFKEILDSYLRVNRSKVAKKSDLARSTVSTAFSKKSNPTIKTIARIVHEAAMESSFTKKR